MQLEEVLIYLSGLAAAVGSAFGFLRWLDGKHTSLEDHTNEVRKELQREVSHALQRIEQVAREGHADVLALADRTQAGLANKADLEQVQFGFNRLFTVLDTMRSEMLDVAKQVGVKREDNSG